jgi:lipopolysaccharide transport protein LptA
MANFLPEPLARRDGLGRRITLGAAAVAAIALLTGATSTGTIGEGADKITWSARDWKMNYKTNVMHLSGDVKIVRGVRDDLSVVADEAEATGTSKDFKNSHWVFTGKVHVRTESQGDLRADRTTLEIVNGALASAHATGSPAQFEQTQSKNGSVAQGHANIADYDVVAGTVKLTGAPWLSYANGQNIVNAASITYNVREQEVQGKGDSGGERAHMTVTPKPDTNAGTGKP